MTSGKSLTQPPENLKEAIDWVLRVSGGDHHGGFDTDRLVKAVVKPDDLNMKGQTINIRSLVDALCNGLKSFVGYQCSGRKVNIGQNGIVKPDFAYTSAYTGSWHTDVSVGSPQNPTDKEITCASIFFTAIQLIFEGLTELYYNCNKNWSRQSLNGNSNALKHFMEKNGFSDNQLNTDMKGERIMSQALKGFEEFDAAYNPILTSLDALRSQLEQNAWSNPSNYPLSALYILATYVYVHSASPATPSFLGYSGTAALAGGAYGLNLGGLGTLMSALLAPCGGQDGTQALTNEVKKLLDSVKGSDSGLGNEIDNVKKALTPGPTGLIAKLAEGLQQFIGYEPGSSNTTGKLTGAGILPANVAKHQVCNAVLNFVIRFLEGLCEIKASGHGEVLKVISTLRRCVGTGQVPKGFKDLVKKIEEKVKEIDTKLQNNQNKLHGAFQIFKTLVTTLKYEQNGSLSVTQDSAQVTSFLNVVKNGIKQDGSSNFRTLCDALNALFKDDKIKKGASQSNNEPLKVSDAPLKSKYNAVNPDSVNGDINNLKNTKPVNAAVFTAVRDAARAFIAELQTKTYTSYYKGATWTGVSGHEAKCAKIFLGCLPLYYQAFTYIYWGCHDNGGRWRNLTLAGGDLKSYFDSQGLLPTFVESSRTGAHIAESSLQKFSEFTQGMREASPPSPFTYSSFNEKLQKNVEDNGNNHFSGCPLSALFYGASCYFRYQQITTANIAVRAPKTIREMLYFLAALQFSPQYDAFESYVTEYFKGLIPNSNGQTPDVRSDSDLKLQVADSGITPKPGSSASSDTLSAADLKSYLASTFHLAPAFIGLIQGPSASISGEPWLHSLFSNSQLNLSIPSSGAGIFGALSNYTYALQFQLSFLYIQCRDTYTVGCGWRDCRFGKDINATVNEKIALSHICVTGCTKNSGSHDHNSKPYECEHTGCGSTGKGSPLQAFLTDKLKGFSRGHPADPSSHLAACSGSRCHVPMGFNPNDLRAASNGNAQCGLNIAYALGSFCGGFNTPLRQLSEKLGCLTRRTPRTLGDLFGFMWHLNGQLFPKSALSTKPWLNDLVKHTPFSYAVEQKTETLQSFVGSSQSHSGSHDTHDLKSLSNSGCKEKDKNCGPYLYPLTHSDGATFGKPAPYASTYLSCMVYLTDDLQSGFQELLDTFNGHACKGCKSSSTCSSHTSASQCQCASVVDCADVLPLFYRYGFRFLSAFRLKGVGNGGDNSKRSCQKFHDQLSNILKPEAPLNNLITTIDEFLFLFRYYFLSHLSAFWTIYICLILYTFFFLLDTLHLRSHLKLTSSHTVPPLALLTSGKPLPVTKLMYIGQ
ncbi:variant erythrocyte surface antigen-1 family protein [Babesia caballi]|uniref:Variant erythrocyte surface antigen-1 family protein n=1 Tax=Babesia caballi TaxID=5871 RepID=A0AAV4LS25_BABCB|nr:variant erythrocyte surface antigen-1 family protein [Babesia caballi]